MGVPRKASAADFYHVTNRGSGGQVIFEDDEDRRHFLVLLKNATATFSVTVIAWVLMDNHFHLVVKARLTDLSSAMKELCSKYAMDLNRRHGRVGHLFKGPFFSSPIDDEAYLLEAVLYTHENPVRAGIVSRASDYPWSSWREYAGKVYVVDTSAVLACCGGVDGFKSFSNRNAAEDISSGFSATIKERAALDEARTRLGLESLVSVKGLPKSERNRALVIMKECGLTVSQIARQTGVSKSTVSRVVR